MALQALESCTTCIWTCPPGKAWNCGSYQMNPEFRAKLTEAMVTIQPRIITKGMMGIPELKASDIKTAPITWYEKEKPMDAVIDFRDKKYRQTDKDWTLADWIMDADDDQCPRDSIGRFSRTFNAREWIYEPYQVIPLIEPVVVWLTTESDQHIPWLVENGYLEEAKEEVAYPVGQWFKAGEAYYRLSRVGHDLAAIISISTRGIRHYGEPFKVKDFQAITLVEIHEGANSFDPIHDEIPIPPPRIVEQGEGDFPNRRFPGSCVHHKTSGCLNDKAIKHFGTTGSVNCVNRIPDGCPEYNTG